MKLEVGMYVRYVPTLGDYTQKISKITKTKNCLLDMAYYLDNEKEPVFSSYFDDILKTSYNPIDLIEVGDYVNGYLVTDVYRPDGNEVFRIEIERDTLRGHIIDKSSQIKSIVTKEQFENMTYEVEQ